MNKTKKQFNVDEHLKTISELAKGAPEPEEILAEFERGDYSSLDSNFLKERNIKKSNRKKKTSSKRPEKAIQL